jgi:hypothetical protein
MKGQSELGLLLQQIDAECAAAFQGLYGLASGTSQHDFINAKYDRIGALQEELEQLVGEDKAAQIIVERLDRQ